METTAAVNTLQYDAARCLGCGLCTVVCPHGVFSLEDRRARLVRYEACIECGACQRNCPADAIRVDSGPGCAAALIHAALTGGEPTCEPADCACGAPVTGAPVDTETSCCAASRGGWLLSRRAQHRGRPPRCCC